jgi:hypothetical protein
LYTSILKEYATSIFRIEVRRVGKLIGLDRGSGQEVQAEWKIRAIGREGRCI